MRAVAQTQPAHIINPDADIRSLIAWCWCEVSRLSDSLMLNVLAGQGAIDGAMVADTAYQQLAPVTQMLMHLVDVSFRDSQAAATAAQGDAA